MNEEPIIENISTVKSPFGSPSLNPSSLLQESNAGGSPVLGAEDIHIVKEEDFIREGNEEAKPIGKGDSPKKRSPTRKRSKKWKKFSGLQRREEIDRNDPDNQPFVPTEDFQGPLSSFFCFSVLKSFL